MATTREDIGATEELEQLKALVAEQQLRLEALETHRERESPNGGETTEKRSTRRQMLKLAGASLVGAAGAAALKAIPAAAADGDIVTVGGVFSETIGFATGISQSANYGIAGYFVNTSAYGGVGLEGRATSNFTTGVMGRALATYGGLGVDGRGTGTGTMGIGGYSGVYGYSSSTTGHGVFGYTYHSGTFGAGVQGIGNTGVIAGTIRQNSRALYAYTGASYSQAIQAKTTATGAFLGLLTPAVSVNSASGIGTVTYGYTSGLWAGGNSLNPAARIANFSKAGGVDLKLGGTGRLLQAPTVTGGVGAPNYNPASSGGYGELVRAYDGALWISGNPAITGYTLKAAWKRVNAVRVDSADGAGTPYKPKRVIDTRSGPINVKGTYRKVLIAGTGTGKSAIPSDAVAIIGNLTAVNYTGGGYMSIMPADATYTPGSDPSSVNFMVGQKAIANSFVVGLGTSGTDAGKVKVYTAGHNSHFIIDVTGYLQ